MTNQTTQPSNKISMDKKYKTRDGRDVTILGINCNNKFVYPVRGSTAGELFSFTEDGFFISDKYTHRLDLIEIQEESSNTEVPEMTNNVQPTETQDQPIMYQMLVETHDKTFKSTLMTEDEADTLMNSIREYLCGGSFTMLNFKESDSKTTIIQGDILKQSIISFVKVQG